MWSIILICLSQSRHLEQSSWCAPSLAIIRRQLKTHLFLCLKITGHYWRPSQYLAVLFLFRNRFLALVLPNLDRSRKKFAHTHCCTEYTCGPTWTAIGAWVAPDQTRTTIVFFIILVTHPKYYIQTADRRNFGGKPSKWRWGRVLLWKIAEFCSVGELDPKTAFFAF